VSGAAVEAGAAYVAGAGDPYGMDIVVLYVGMGCAGKEYVTVAGAATGSAIGIGTGAAAEVDKPVAGTAEALHPAGIGTGAATGTVYVGMGCAAIGAA